MARRRMIDQHIWETAYDKGWGPDEITIMVAAISAADDEGFGRISLIKRNVSEMFSGQKFEKTLKKLQNSIEIFEKIYFFLPNWSEYQTVSHPKQSKIKPIYDSKNNNLTPNTSRKIHENFSNDSIVSEVNISEVSLKEVKRKSEITSSIFFEKCKKLYQENTRIRDPNIKTHIRPIIEIYDRIPEDLNQNDVEECIELTFKSLDKNKGVNVTFLTQNIMAKIAEKHEEVLKSAKTGTLKEANSMRIQQKLLDNEANRSKIKFMVAQLKEFYDKNQNSFSYAEKSQIVRFLNENDILSLEKIIKPKMDEVTLV